MNIKIKTGIVGIVCLIGGTLLVHTARNSSEINPNVYLQLDNINALASNEGGKNYCSGSGSIDCNGQKVEQKISTFGLPIYK